MTSTKKVTELIPGDTIDIGYTYSSTAKWTGDSITATGGAGREYRPLVITDVQPGFSQSLTDPLKVTGTLADGRTDWLVLPATNTVEVI